MKTNKENSEEFYPANQEEWRKWLEENHSRKNSVWLIFRKEGTGNPNLSWSQAVDEAICFGWIDNVKKTIDDEFYKQYFCPRKANSIWSKINKNKVALLTQQGLMKEEGVKSVEIAKENGSWSILDEVDALQIPDDLLAELEARDGAKACFEQFSKSIKKGILYWVISAKRPATRQKRILEIAERASQNLKPKQFS
jgi:uncharacterized protein YdeI (YjbR/CyaY-like superfamily)